MAKDTIYSSELSEIPGFTFDQTVVEVFDDMISRSVPLYQEVGTTSVTLAKGFCQPNTSIFDMGCSTGTLLLELGRQNLPGNVQLVGIDSSASMIAEARRRLSTLPSEQAEEIKFEQHDILDYKFENASVCICNYTLQFLPVETRSTVLEAVQQALCLGGLLLLTEKVRHPHQKLQTLITELHHDFKRAHGYSELEIAQKRQAIEDVLVPLTLEENITMLKAVGFDSVYPVLTWYNFVTFAALRLP